MLDLRDSPAALGACRLAPPVHRETISGGSSEFHMRYRSVGLRDSGAVAPSALPGLVAAADSPDIAANSVLASARAYTSAAFLCKRNFQSVVFKSSLLLVFVCRRAAPTLEFGASCAGRST